WNEPSAHVETPPGSADQRLARQSVLAFSSRIAGQGGKTFRPHSQTKEPFSSLARRAFIVCAAKPGMGAADGRSDGVARFDSGPSRGGKFSRGIVARVNEV